MSFVVLALMLNSLLVSELLKKLYAYMYLYVLMLGRSKFLTGRRKRHEWKARMLSAAKFFKQKLYLNENFFLLIYVKFVSSQI